MHRYWMRYKKGLLGVEYVNADSVNGLKHACDTYVFKRGDIIEAVIPKANVVSIERVNAK